MRNCGFINPENIEEYIARHGYLALADSLLHKQPIDVIGVIKRSGLRGRGGGGFPTGLNGSLLTNKPLIPNMLFAMPMKATPELLWIVLSWKETLIPL